MKRSQNKKDAVLEMMNYSNGSIVSKWKDRFAKREAPKTKRATQKITMPKIAVSKVPETPHEEKADGPALKLIKSTPVDFRFERRENPSDFEHVAFAVKACSANHNCMAFQYLHVEELKTGSRVIGCDGRRLHVAEIKTKIRSGNYKAAMTRDVINLCKADDDVRYPDWVRVVPDKAATRGVINLEKSGFSKDKEETANLAIAFNAFSRQTGETVNLRYLEDLPRKIWVVCSQDKKGLPVIFKESGAEETNYAVMMPLPPNEVETAALAKAA